MTNDSFSVLLSTYEGDDPEGLERALNSVVNQTVRPDEIVVVADGPITEALESVLDEFEYEYGELLSRTSLAVNRGLGAALRHGVEVCSHDLVARLDADDVAREKRFERQLSYLENHPEVDVLGGYIAEFLETPEQIQTVREVPTTPEGVRSKARFRSPVNHPSVMFRRDAVLDAGNYRPLRSMQDYELWMRMLSQGYTITNIPEVLVDCQAGDDLYYRRGGLDYARLETRLQWEYYRMGMIPLPVLLLNIVSKIPIRLAPNKVRGFVYRNLLRS